MAANPNEVPIHDQEGAIYQHDLALSMAYASTPRVSDSLRSDAREIAGEIGYYAAVAGAYLVTQWAVDKAKDKVSQWTGSGTDARL